MPNQDQRALKRSYRTRVFAVTYIMLACAVLAATIALVPSYAKVAAERDAQTAELASISQAVAPGSDALRTELDSDMRRLRTLATSDPVRPSLLIAETISARGPVRINALSIEAMSSTTATLVVQGIAPTRDTLVAFKNRLENMIPGNKVELPISELTKSKDISFSLRFTTQLP